MTMHNPTDMKFERCIEREDTEYNLYSGKCSDCGAPVHFITRVSGAAVSQFQIAPDTLSNLDEFIDEIHESFSVDVLHLIEGLRDSIEGISPSPRKNYFDCEEIGPYRIRMLDRARLILGRFSRRGMLNQLVSNADNLDDDVATAFVLGYLASEDFWIRTHEDATLEGYRHQEGREAGRPRARDARLRLGKRSRRGVLEGAHLAYKHDPSLRRNDSKTAEFITNLKLDALRKSDGTYLGIDAIVKHLRAARDEGQL